MSLLYIIELHPTHRNNLKVLTGGKVCRRKNDALPLSKASVTTAPMHATGVGSWPIKPPPSVPLTLDVRDNDGYSATGRRPPQPLAEVNHILKQLRTGAPLQERRKIEQSHQGE